MRADRLVAILLMLQTRGRVTAAEVAAELEVSERTARRDLDALGMAGLPVYSQQGRNGGWALAGGGRTDLSGLTAAEARALFLVAGPASSATPDVRAALRKLVRALPEPFRSDAEAAAGAVVVDPAAWGGSAPVRPAPPYLDLVQRTVIEGEQVRLGYVARDRSPSERTVHPLGLAAKGRAWYLVADTEAGLRTFRIDRITSAEPTGERVVRPAGFDLAEAWQLIADEVEQRRTASWMRGTASPEVIYILREIFGRWLRIGPTEADGRVPIEVGGSSDRAMVAQLAGFGAMIEITDPPEARSRLAAIGAELSTLYAD